MRRQRQDPNPKVQVETENTRLTSRARARKEVIKESTLGADNYQQVTTAKASMATIDVRQVEREAQRRTLRVAVLAFALLVAAGSLLGLLNRGPRPVTAPPSFIADKLGADLPRQRLSHRLAGDATLTIDRSGFAVQNRAGSVRLSSIDRPAGSWLGHARGAQRNTAFGNEAIVLDRNATGVGGEQFLTVGKGYGTHTWSWNLSSTFGRPRVGDDGYVAFIRGHYLTQKMFVKPVLILDASGKDVTPKGLAWQIGIDRSGHYLLQLPLDDSKLPLPYVIDPGITTDVFLGTTGNTTAGLNLALNVPTGTKADDLLLAHIAWKIAAAGTTISVTKPAAWTQAIEPGASGTATTDTGGAIYWKTASSTDGNGSTSYTWALSTAEIASGGIGAYAGVEATSPIDNSASLGTVRPGSNTTVLPMPSLLPTVNNTEVVSLIGWNARDTGALLTAPAGEAVRWRTNNSGVVTSFSSDLLQTTAATVSTNATQPNGKVASMTYRVSLKPDTTAPAMSSAVVAADGVTVTVTWSENIDQTQAVPGSAFSIAPNGGAGVAGTATAVSYPAANQTRFTLSSTVHHLDSLALTYTKPGSNPMVGDFAANAAVTATLNN